MSDRDYKRYVLGGIFMLLVLNFNACSERAKLANQIQQAEALCQKRISSTLIP